MSGATLKTLIDGITCLVGLTIPIAVMLAILFFVWTIFQGYGKMDNAEKRKELRESLVWVVLSIFVVATLGGLVTVIVETFQLAL